MSDKRLAQIKARAEAATPGPLYASPNYLIGGWWIQTEEDKRLEREHGDFFRREDAEFYAAAREDTLWLVAQVEELRDTVLFAQRSLVQVNSNQATINSGIETVHRMVRELRDQLAAGDDALESAREQPTAPTEQ